MRGNPGILLVFIFAFALIIDLYTFRGVSTLVNNSENRYRIYINLGFWLITFITLLWLIWFYFSFSKFSYHQVYKFVTIFMGFFILFYVPKLFFIAFEIVQDVLNLMARITGAIFPKNSNISNHAIQISRSDFILQIGLIIATIPFLSIIWGMWKGRYNYTIQKVELGFKNLPKSFNGLKIVQISDLHLGSFAGKPGKLEPAIEMINNLNPDYIFFTGDLVNNIASEAEEFIPLLKKLKAKYGKYSILGNHDYGEYYSWPSNEALKENMEQLFRHHESAGFVLLKNESVKFERNGESIALIGVENWGLPPFKQYGNLQKSYIPVKDIPFKILLSHDPSHWDAEVRPTTNIDLTLSGHTHGMQFAFRIPGWRWSPVKFKYPRWAGLYREGDHSLYVNIGLGYIGFPGRVGTPPEITLFSLNTA
jgi:uncharacterized protein